MSKGIIDSIILTDIADAIRSKDGSYNSYKPSEMADAILAIPSGSSETQTRYSIYGNWTFTNDGLIQADSQDKTIPGDRIVGDWEHEGVGYWPVWFESDLNDDDNPIVFKGFGYSYHDWCYLYPNNNNEQIWNDGEIVHNEAMLVNFGNGQIITKEFKDLMLIAAIPVDGGIIEF